MAEPPGFGGEPTGQHPASAGRADRPGWPAYLSIAAILLYWIYSATTQLLRDQPHQVPGGIKAIALGVCIKTLIVVIVVWALLRAGKESIPSLGLSPGGARGILLYGLLPGIGLFLVTTLVLNDLVSRLMDLMGFPGSGGPSALPGLFLDPREAPFWIVAAIVGDGFSEELQRAFMLTRFEKVLGRPGLAAALAIGSVVFGLGHLYQGTAGAASAGITGFANALIFLRRRKVIDAMIAHAAFDLIGIAAAYALYAG